jgi:hypothetical protein
MPIDQQAPEDAETQTIIALIQDFAAQPSRRYATRQASFPWNNKGVHSMKSPTRRRFLVAALVTCLLLIGVVVGTPSLRARAAQILGLNRADSDVVVEDAVLRGGLHGPELRSIAEVQADTPHPIYAPAVIPTGYGFQGAAYNADMGNGVHSVGVDLYYTATVSPELYISVSQLTLAEICTQCPNQIGASAVVEAVDINGVQAAYYQGYWNVTSEIEAGDGTGNIEVDDLTSVWDPTYDLQTLVWQADGFEFSLRAPLAVAKADLLALARSLRP